MNKLKKELHEMNSKADELLKKKIKEPVPARIDPYVIERARKIADRLDVPLCNVIEAAVITFCDRADGKIK